MPDQNRNPIRTALIGCREVGHTHAQALQSRPASEFVAVGDNDPGQAAQFGDQYSAQPYTDLEKMLAEAQVEMLSDSTPHPAHAESIVTAAQHGVHVLSEKPLSPDLLGCDRSIRECHQNNVKLSVISQRRVYKPVIRMRQAIEQGKIGAPILATLVVMGWRSAKYCLMDAWRGKWASEGGGVLVNQIVHQLDVL